MDSLKYILRGIVLSLIVVATVQAAEPDVIFITGAQYQFDESHFDRKESVLTAKIPIYGATEAPLFIDIDAFVSGLGYYDLGFRCHGKGSTSDGKRLISPPDCDFASVKPSNRYYFGASIKVQCGNTLVGSTRDDRNRYLSQGEIKNIQSQATNYIKRRYDSLPPIIPIRNSLNLLIDNKRFVSDEPCNELTVTIRGEKTKIERIYLDVIVGEVF